MERTTAEVAAVFPVPGRGPVPMTLVLPDGTSERGHSLLSSGAGTTSTYLVPKVPGVLGLLVVLAASVSALTRRRSFVTVAGRSEPAPAREAGPGTASSSA